MKARRYLESIWLVQVPILSLAVLALFGFAASGLVRNMLGGLF